jgi:anti-sigma factor (TIGR02949 family)
MDSMDCTQARNLLSEYQDGALGGADAAALAAHLRGCGECAGCADALLAVRELLRALPPDPAPTELLARVLAAVETEGQDAHARSAPGGTDATRPFLSRFRIPLEAAAALLLFASVYWYRQTPAPPALPPSAPIAQAPETAPPAGVSPEASSRTAIVSPSGIRLPRGNPKTEREGAPVAPKPRTWTAADLPSVPTTRASTDSERIVPISPFPGPAAEPLRRGAPAFEGRQGAESEGGADFLLSRSFAAPPYRLLRPLPYGRDIVVDVEPESREGAEERIAGAALRLGGIFERIERDGESAGEGAAGTIRVILPEAAAAGFLDELRRIGNVPKEGLPSATDLPAGPRPGTIAYAVRIRVR